MAYHPEDLQLDEGYWRALLAEVEQMPIPATRPAHSSPVPQVPAEPAPGTPAAESGGNEQPEHVAPIAPPAAAVNGVTNESAWRALREALDGNTPVMVDVTGCNRGGLIVHFDGLRGFIPSSHLNGISPDMDEPSRRSALANHIGQSLSVRVIELEQVDDRAVFSERTSAEGDPTLDDIPAVLREVEPGQTRRGTVTNLTAFGAFVDLGGYEGLIHVSELSWSRVNHPRDMLHLGEEVHVFVMSVVPEEGRIALSLKRARPNPWENIEQRYHVGQIVHGTVTNVVQFGAFVKVEEELEGLVHVSELAEGSFMHPRNIVREGQQVTARVIGVHSGQRRLALSLRGVAHAEIGEPLPAVPNP